MTRIAFWWTCALLLACNKPSAPPSAPMPGHASAPSSVAGPAAATTTGADPAGAATPPQTVKHVVLWHAYRDDERKALDELVTAWNQKHPAVQVDVLAVPFDALIDKLQVAVPHGNPGEFLRWRTELFLRNYGTANEAGERGDFTDFAAYTALSYGFPSGKVQANLRGEYVSGTADTGQTERWRVSPSIKIGRAHV